MKTQIKINIAIDHGGLKKNRELAGLSVEKLAEKAGLDPETIRQYEDGTVDLNSASLLTLLKLCRALDGEISNLLTDSETIQAWEKYWKKYNDEDDDDEDEDEDEENLYGEEVNVETANEIINRFKNVIKHLNSTESE